MDVAWSPDGTKIGSVAFFAERGFNIGIWDANTYELLAFNWGPNASAIEWSPDSSRFMITSEIGSYVLEVGDLRTPEMASATVIDILNDRHLLTPSAPLTDILWDPTSPSLSASWITDGTRSLLAVGSRLRSQTESSLIETRHIDIHDGDTLTLLDTIFVPSDLVPEGGNLDGVSLSPDLQRIAAKNGYLRAVYVWDVNTGLLLGTYATKTEYSVTSIAWSPDSKQIAYGDVGGIVIADAPELCDIYLQPDEINQLIHTLEAAEASDDTSTSTCLYPD